MGHARDIKLCITGTLEWADNHQMITAKQKSLKGHPGGNQHPTALGTLALVYFPKPYVPNFCNCKSTQQRIEIISH